MSKDIPVAVACWLVLAVIAADLIDMAAKASAHEQLIAYHQPTHDQPGE